MILTRFHLNARRHGARALLSSPQAMHAALLSGFPPGREGGRILWRVDADDPLRPTVYVVSQDRPDFTHIEEQGGWPTQPTTLSASYHVLLESLTEGQTWAFRLRANPTHRATIGGRKLVVAHATVGHQQRWLAERAERVGVNLGSGESPTMRVTDRSVLSFRRGEGRVTLGVATYDGVLTVTDPALLRTALVEGIGRAKAYGCGLMTLAAPR